MQNNKNEPFFNFTSNNRVHLIKFYLLSIAYLDIAVTSASLILSSSFTSIAIFSNSFIFVIFPLAILAILANSVKVILPSPLIFPATTNVYDVPASVVNVYPVFIKSFSVNVLLHSLTTYFLFVGTFFIKSL